METEHARCFGYIGKGAIALVAHQRIGMLAVAVLPSSPHSQKIEPTVVVEVSVHQLQATGYAGEANFPSALDKSAVASVAKIAELVVQTPGRDHQVEVPVVVKIVHDTAAG